MFLQKVLKYKGRVVFEKIRMPYFKRIPKLYQENEACFMFINKGQFSVRTPDEFLRFDKGRALLAKCFDYHFETDETQRASSDGVEVMGVLIHQELVEELLNLDLNDKKASVPFNATQVVVDKMFSIFRDGLDLLLENPELADETTIALKLKEFLILICKTQKDLTQREFLSGLFNVEKVQLKRVIQRNLYSTMSLSELAFLCNLSLSSFKRRFKEEFGMAPQSYLISEKLNRAAYLLKDGNARITEVAHDCGFESQQTFNRNFRSRFGVSPRLYRQALLT